MLLNRHELKESLNYHKSHVSSIIGIKHIGIEKWVLKLARFDYIFVTFSLEIYKKS